ncbi:MAG: carbamoyltransferase HypF [Thermoplasmata archaeon]|nr:carbamoyltransferase HypF [Thermoplasmata archaeon]
MRIVFRGTVQGVGFRPAVYRTAVSLGCRGSVRNDGSSVTVEVDKGEEFLEAFLKELPPLAHVDSVEKSEYTVPDSVKGFTIAGSSRSASEHIPSIPADTAVCPECIADMKHGRRKGYPFTTCTDCGPRFTLLEALPYDRERTAMAAFPRCFRCGEEYSDPSKRRFHHQTICCPVCGPSYRLVDSQGNQIEGDPIATFASMLEEGKIGISKGWGGMHISCTLGRVKELREWYGRKYKPFAIMVRDAEAAERYTDITPEEMEQLTSPQRPIVLLRKKRNDETLELLSPGIDTVGVFLPYTGMQVLLFDILKTDALVMTSANPPGEPMITDDNEILNLGADMYLLHDQEIINRADDSVLRLCGEDVFFLRKSRGNIPCYYTVDEKEDVAAVGAQENLAGAVASKGRIYPTQYIGNGEGMGVPEYLEEAVRLQIRLLGARPSIIAEDLHLAYLNRPFARRLAEETGAEIVDVQHHWAHGASLMVDRGITDHLTVLTLDGTGHGDDGKAWGGEVLSCTLEGYKRLAHLEYIPLIGGQKAVHDIRRLRLAIDMINGERSNTGFSDQEVSILTKLANNSVGTSSFGRILDALAYSTGVCSERTYDGEPAMRMERYLDPSDYEDYSTETRNGVISTAHLFSGLGRMKDPTAEVSGIVRAILSEMVDIACDDAASNGESRIGITGGVSYNVPITLMVRDLAKARGMDVVTHCRIPNGDGGISTGQAAIALRRA